MRLNDHVAIVTGASDGIGRATALAMAVEGAQLVLAARSVDRLRALEHHIQQRGGRALAVPTDVTDSRQVEEMVRQAIGRFGRVDVLVNNAGYGAFGPVHQLDEADWDQMMAVNLKGAFLCSRAVLPSMMERRSGHIINVSSVAGTTTFEGGGGYCASKWGLMALTDVLMKETKPYQIKVSAVCPGSVQTNFGGTPPKDYSLRPEDVAEVIVEMAAAPGRVILNTVIMRPMVPPG